MDGTLPSLGAALVLALVYALRGGTGGADPEGRFWSRRRWISAAAGISVAYVFVDVLPELGAQNLAVRNAAATELHFAEARIYVLALIAFVVMYGLQHFVLSHHEERTAVIAAGERDAVYWLHVGGFALYSALIGYLLVERAERGTIALLVYTVAMGVHFLIVNRALLEEHGMTYRRGGHWALAASILVGWGIGTVTPLSHVVFARLFALLAGGVVITSLRSELPGRERGRFWPFCLGALGFAALIMMA